MKNKKREPEHANKNDLVRKDQKEASKSVYGEIMSGVMFVVRDF